MFRKLLSLTVFLFSICLAQSGSGPKIAVQPEEYDFGSISQGQKVSHDFEIYNIGNDELKILNVRGSCGCTAATPAKTNLLPGDSTKLSVVFNSAGKIGKQNKVVFIKSNDSSNSIFNIRFTGMVVNDNVVESKTPKIFLPEKDHDFGKVAEGKVVDYNFTIKNRGSLVLEVEDIKTSCGCTAAMMSNKTLKPGEDGILKVELDTKNRSGKMERTVTIKTNDPENSTSTLTIYVDVVKGQS